MRQSIAMLLAGPDSDRYDGAPPLLPQRRKRPSRRRRRGRRPPRARRPRRPPTRRGTVSWENLDSRIREGSLNSLILGENISGIEGIDYDQMYEDLRRQLNDIANAQWYITIMGGDSSSLDQAYDALRGYVRRSEGRERSRRTTPMWSGSWRTPPTRSCPAARPCTSLWWVWSSRRPTASGAWRPLTAT